MQERDELTQVELPRYRGRGRYLDFLDLRPLSILSPALAHIA